MVSFMIGFARWFGFVPATNISFQCVTNQPAAPVRCWAQCVVGCCCCCCYRCQRCRLCYALSALAQQPAPHQRPVIAEPQWHRLLQNSHEVVKWVITSRKTREAWLKVKEGEPRWSNNDTTPPDDTAGTFATDSLWKRASSDTSQHKCC